MAEVDFDPDIIQGVFIEKLAMRGTDFEGITQWTKLVKAPVSHQFAARVVGVSAQDVARVFKRDKDLLDRPCCGKTPLDLAIACDNVGGLEALLELGADPNNKRGMKPLYAKRHFESGMKRQ